MGSGIGPGWGILGLSSGPLALKLVSGLDHGGSAGAGTRHAWSCSAGDFVQFHKNYCNCNCNKKTNVSLSRSELRQGNNEKVCYWRMICMF